LIDDDDFVRNLRSIHDRFDCLEQHNWTISCWYDKRYLSYSFVTGTIVTRHLAIRSAHHTFLSMQAAGTLLCVGAKSCPPSVVKHIIHVGWAVPRLITAL
jgi:hypothetical protein